MSPRGIRFSTVGLAEVDEVILATVMNGELFPMTPLLRKICWALAGLFNTFLDENENETTGEIRRRQLNDNPVQTNAAVIMYSLGDIGIFQGVKAGFLIMRPPVITMLIDYQTKIIRVQNC